ncbi:hypothetical protein NDU88_004038 [Pleurodeles waltl]|uniref:Uncharacterized protein n=1 Tax=Pleurodeles waltl TaxID=8319 RepID=A0AAV7QBR9_PLEWA|nr:hypothetical protein NDU88_004038 [Pleurodeles waltl]
MAQNSQQGQRSRTAPKKSGGHQEEVERPMGEGAFSGLQAQHCGTADWRRTPTSSPPKLTTWEEQVLTIMHPEGLGGVGGGMDTGSRRTVTTPEGPDTSTPPTEEAHSDDSSSALLEPDDQPRPPWASGQPVPLAQAQPNTDLPPSGNTSTAPTQGPKPPYPGQVNQLCVHHYREPRITHHPNNNRDLGAVVVGTRSRGRRHRNSSIMGAYHHSQETMATVLDKFQETQRMQDKLYLGFREELRTISSTLGTIVGVPKDIQQILRDTVALQGAPTLARTMNCPPHPPALVDRTPRHRTTTPAPHPLQTDNHHASGP